MYANVISNYEYACQDEIDRKVSILIGRFLSDTASHVSIRNTRVASDRKYRLATSVRTFFSYRMIGNIGG